MENVIINIINVVDCIVLQCSLLLFVISYLKRNKSMLLIGYVLRLLSIFTDVGFSIYYVAIDYSSTGTFITNIARYLVYVIFWTVLFIIVSKFYNKALSQDNVQSYAIEPDATESKDDINLLNEYKNLLDIGAISQEEFESKKKELLKL